MSVFSTNRVEALKKQSSDAIGIFQNTIEKLATTNASVRQEKAKKLQEIEAKQREVEVLDGIETQNETFITKINDFLGTNEKD